MQETEVRKENSRKKVNWVYIVLVLMIAVQLGNIIYCFQVKKEGWHSDEIWSYGYANSYYQKDIYMDNDCNLINLHEWVSGDTLRDYIVANKGERFEYGSIYQNQINDLSPPLHSMILHTICSFFPEKFSLWFSFVINIAAFLVCMVFMFKTTRLLKGDWFALCCCAVYGFSLAARDTYIYLRMYAMCTTMVMIILYHLLVYMKEPEGKRLFNKNLIAISITAFLGFLTHYYMIAFMGILTFLVCVYYLFRKKIKQMFVFGFSQLVSLLLSFAAFPALLHVVQSHNAEIAADTKAVMNYNFDLRFRILSNFITMKLFSIHVPLFRSGRLVRFLVCAIVILIWMIPLIYLLRDTALIKGMMRRIKFLVHNFRAIGKWMLRRINWYYVILAIWIPCQIITVGETSNVYTMGEYEDRYLMYIYPVALIVVMALAYQIMLPFVKKKKYRKHIVILLALLLVVINVRNQGIYTEYYFDRFSEGQDIEKCIEDKECIYVERNNWFLTAMAPVLMNAKQFFMCAPEDYDNYLEEYQKKCEEGEVVVIINKSFVMAALSSNESAGVIVTEEDEDAIKSQKQYDEMIDFFENLEPSTEMKKVGTSTIFGRLMEIYIINP